MHRCLYLVLVGILSPEFLDPRNQIGGNGESVHFQSENGARILRHIVDNPLIKK